MLWKIAFIFSDLSSATFKYFHGSNTLAEAMFILRALANLLPCAYDQHSHGYKITLEYGLTILYISVLNIILYLDINVDIGRGWTIWAIHSEW